ncbi:trypsin-like serine peptidase [Methylobacterium nonmethylotrophicum]|nr:trypsin-like serine protease [Methylobacterium nonmethylotrophicum]
MLDVPTRSWLHLDTLADASDASLVGPRDSRIQEIRTTVYPWNTIVYLCRDFGGGACSGCSGVLIAPRLVLTAGHCVWSLRHRRAPRSIRVCPGRRDRDTLPYGAIEATATYAPAAFVRGPDRTVADWGLIVLPKAFRGIERFMALHAPDDAEVKRIASHGLVSVAGYPSDRPIGTLWRHAERLKRATNLRLFYTVDTCPGHSGSPIFVGGAQLRIVGVHTAGVLDPEGRSYGCKRDTTLAPLGALNSGIRLTAAMIGAIRKIQSGEPVPESMMRLP